LGRDFSAVQIEEEGEHREQGDADVRRRLVGPHRSQVDPPEELGESDEDEDDGEPGDDEKVIPEPGQESANEWSGWRESSSHGEPLIPSTVVHGIAVTATCGPFDD
jgi:hypothetical protein